MKLYFYEAFSCITITYRVVIRCLRNLIEIWSATLEVKWNDYVVACKSTCFSFNSPRYCYTGTYANPQTYKPIGYSRIFKTMCELIAMLRMTPLALSPAEEPTPSSFTSLVMEESSCLAIYFHWIPYYISGCTINPTSLIDPPSNLKKEHGWMNGLWAPSGS